MSILLTLASVVWAAAEEIQPRASLVSLKTSEPMALEMVPGAGLIAVALESSDSGMHVTTRLLRHTDAEWETLPDIRVPDPPLGHQQSGAPWGEDHLALCSRWVVAAQGATRAPWIVADVLTGEIAETYRLEEDSQAYHLVDRDGRPCRFVPEPSLDRTPPVILGDRLEVVLPWEPDHGQPRVGDRSVWVETYDAPDRFSRGPGPRLLLTSRGDSIEVPFGHLFMDPRLAPARELDLGKRDYVHPERYGIADVAVFEDRAYVSVYWLSGSSYRVPVAAVVAVVDP